jgi:hypothetical protein
VITWFVTALRQNAELAIFLALAIGYYVGPLKLGGQEQPFHARIHDNLRHRQRLAHDLGHGGRRNFSF